MLDQYLRTEAFSVLISIITTALRIFLLSVVLQKKKKILNNLEKINLVLFYFLIYFVWKMEKLQKY